MRVKIYFFIIRASASTYSSIRNRLKLEMIPGGDLRADTNPQPQNKTNYSVVTLNVFLGLSLGKLDYVRYIVGF